VTLHVELVSAEAKVWSGDASRVILRTTEGDIGLLTGHAPTLAVLAPGEIRILGVDGETVVADAQDGFLSVEHDRVTLVSDTARLVSGSDG
jgi:F-type H+-transporting ATPase subunit epsilon